jgi:hypothetical protein
VNRERGVFDSGEWLHPLATQLLGEGGACWGGQLELPVVPGGAAQAFLIRRSIAGRNRHAQDRMLPEVVKHANVA